MKKINSINWGGKVLGLIVFLDAILPLIAFLLSKIGLRQSSSFLYKVALGVGGVVTIAAFLVLLLELYQDKKIDQYYRLHQKGKRLLSNGNYECEQCGNREVKKADTYCKICHTHFEDAKDKPPYSQE